MVGMCNSVMVIVASERARATFEDLMALSNKIFSMSGGLDLLYEKCPGFLLQSIFDS